jgi:hypothetical protein
MPIDPVKILADELNMPQWSNPISAKLCQGYFVNLDDKFLNNNNNFHLSGKMLVSQ